MIGKKKEDVFKTVTQNLRGLPPGPGGHRDTLIVGSRNRVAFTGDILMGWGVDPSPQTEKAVQWFIDAYAGNPGPGAKVFYSCYAGTHTSIVAAWIHLFASHGLIPEDHLPGHVTILELPLFDQRLSRDIGTPVLIGEDAYGTQVYALGSGWQYRDLELMLCDLIEVINPEARACIMSVRGFLNFKARLGGFMSRRLQMVYLGRKMIADSLSRRFPDIKEAVSLCLDLSRKWNDNEKKSGGEVLWIDGQGKRGISQQR